jgi:16S rRNA (uracil1498-N3)-methyltransferase
LVLIFLTLDIFAHFGDIRPYFMRRFFLDEIMPCAGLLSIKGTEAKHIATVLRMGIGDRIVLIDSTGKRVQALIESACRHEVLVTLEKALPSPPTSPLRISLCQALLKSSAMDYLVHKTSELGVDQILPFHSARTLLKPSPHGSANKLRRWRDIAQSATKQSDRYKPAEIGPLLSFRELLERWAREDVKKFILWEDETARDLKSLLRLRPPPKQVVGMVGPEGGFSTQEIEAASEAGYISASLGHRVLRAETAAITLVALLQYEWGDLSISPTWCASQKFL